MSLSSLAPGDLPRYFASDGVGERSQPFDETPSFVIASTATISGSPSRTVPREQRTATSARAAASNASASL